MSWRKGSNQHVKKFKWHPDVWKYSSLCLIACFAVIWIFREPATVSPVAEAKQPTQPPALITLTPTLTPTATPTPTELNEVISYITKTFEKEGKHVVVQAIKCFYSESGLQPKKVSKPNKNGTRDAGVAQINDIHGMSIEDRQDYKKNIDKAYKIYKSRGNNWSAWYGKDCN